MTVAQSREPGLGSLATSSDLNTAIRSVGRIKSVPGNHAPAMLLLKQTGCPVLKTGSSGGGSFIHILGARSSDGKTQPGTIHSDSDGVGCTGANNGWVFGGLATNGIVAYAAPLATNPLAADPAKPGFITTVAAANGLSGSVVRDSLSNVHGSSSLDATTTGTPSDVTGKSLVTRGLHDDRYFPAVKSAISGANSVFVSGASGRPTTGGWVSFPTSVDACKPRQAEVDSLNLTSTSKLYVDCATNAGFSGPNSTLSLTINAGTIYFRGVVNPALLLKMPNARHVYVGNHFSSPHPDAILIGNNASFEVNTSGNLDASGNCSPGQSSDLTNKAVLFVRAGTFKQTGSTSLLRMCRTTALLMGGQPDGCVPTAPGTAPTTTPCGGGPGSGQFTQQGGGINWTAPDALDATIDAAGNSLPTARAGWEDPNGPEDLALWSESYGSYNMAGGGLFKVAGVFMVPHADPFVISGGASLSLVNAQFIASTIELNGTGTNITMSVDPNSAITLPEQGLVGLVR